jgi:hypothetical protein
MTLIYQSQIPSNFIGEPVLISGNDSLALKKIEYIASDEGIVYEIRYEYKTSCFNDIKILDNKLAVGHHEHFYLFDTNRNALLLKLKMVFYFGHIYFNANYIYVSDACRIYCISQSGVVLWQTDDLAIDGVVIHDFKDDTIFGVGEYDPPNGWEPFILDIRTGFKL